MKQLESNLGRLRAVLILEKKMRSEYPEKYRVQRAPWLSKKGDRNGLFHLPYIKGKRREVLNVMVGVGLGWEHVSVSLPHRCPTWEEMDYVKRKFWNDDEVVMQLHVAVENHVSLHPYCLHLWRPMEQIIPLPEKIMV